MSQCETPRPVLTGKMFYSLQRLGLRVSFKAQTTFNSVISVDICSQLLKGQHLQKSSSRMTSYFKYRYKHPKVLSMIVEAQFIHR